MSYDSFHDVIKCINHSNASSLFERNVTTFKRLSVIGIDPFFLIPIEDTKSYVTEKTVNSFLKPWFYGHDAWSPTMDLRRACKQLTKSDYGYSGVFFNRRLATVIHLYLTQSSSTCKRDNGIMNSIRQFNQNRLQVLLKLIDLHLDECNQYQGKSIKTINKCLNKYKKITSRCHTDCKSGCPFCIRTSVLYTIYCSICVNSWYQIKTEMNAWESMDIKHFKAFNSCPIHQKSQKNFNMNDHDDDNKNIANIYVYNRGFCYNGLSVAAIINHQSTITDKLQDEQYHTFSRMFCSLARILMRQGKTYKYHYIFAQIIHKLYGYVDKHAHQIARLMSTGLAELIQTQWVWSILDIDRKNLIILTMHTRHVWKAVALYGDACEVFYLKRMIQRSDDNKFQIIDDNFTFDDKDTLLTDIGSIGKHRWYYLVLSDKSQSSRAVFDNKFQMITDKIRYDKSLTNCVYDVYATFFDYSLYLANNKIKNGEKYFHQCFKFRPLNQFLHYQFALYLYNVMKNSKDAWYHLKLAVNGHQKTPQSKFDSLYYQMLVAKDWDYNNLKGVYHYKWEKFMTFCRQLYFQYGKNPKCSFGKCGNTILKTHRCKENRVKHTCKGCKVAMYCCKKCQKIDWKLKHRNECTVFALQELTPQEQRIFDQLIFMLDTWFT